MSLVILEAEADGATWGIIFDVKTERALPLRAFECRADAEGFVAWCLAHAVQLAKIAWAEGTLEALRMSWERERCGACFTTSCSCKGCGVPCTMVCADGCSEARP